MAGKVTVYFNDTQNTVSARSGKVLSKTPQSITLECEENQTKKIIEIPQAKIVRIEAVQ